MEQGDKSLKTALALYKHITSLFLTVFWSGDLAIYIDLDIGQGFMEYCVMVSFDLFYKRKAAIT